MAAKLQTVKPMLSTVSPLIGAQPQDKAAWFKNRDQTVSWRKWYKTKRWQQLRWQTLVANSFTCSMCGKIEPDTSKLVADHKEPHRGNEALFWNPNNLTCLCKHCHDSTKQKMEKRGDFVSITHPSNLRPSIVPLIVVCGAPASGKSFYVQQHKGADDLVIDLDQIASTISGQKGHDWSREKYGFQAMSIRNDMLASLSRQGIQERYEQAWFIISEPTADKRRWWEDKLKPTRTVVIETSEDLCLSNAAQDKDRNQTDTVLAINRWWNTYQRRANEVQIKPQGM